MSVAATLATATPPRPQRRQQAGDDRRRGSEQQARRRVHRGRRHAAGDDADHLDREQAAAQRVHDGHHADIARHVDELGIERAVFGEVARRFDVHREVADRARRDQQDPRDPYADGQSEDDEAHGTAYYAARFSPAASSSWPPAPPSRR